MPSPRVSLVVPPFSMSSLEWDEGSQNRGYYVYYPPLGLGSMATVLNQQGYQASVIDSFMENLDETGLLKKLESEAPQVVGLTLTTPTLRAVRRLAQGIRERLPNTRIILGGPHLNVDSTVLEHLEWDDAVSGEADLFLPELLGQEPTKKLHEVPAPNLQTLSPIDRSLFHSGPYRNPFNGLPTTSLEASRGCPFRCSFCSRTLSDAFREYAPERVAEEMADCKKSGIGFFVFIDELFTKNRKHALVLMEAIRRKAPGIKFSVQTRVEFVDEELMAEMSAAGLEVISFGVESFIPEHRAVMGKHFSNEQIHKAIAASKKAGVKINAFMLQGIPGQSAEDVRKDLTLAKQSGVHFTLPNVLTILPGTPLGKEIGPTAWTDYLLEKADLPLASQLPRPQLTQLKRWWFRRWYLRPAMVWQLLLGVKSTRDFWALSSMGLNILRDYALRFFKPPEKKLA